MKKSYLSIFFHIIFVLVFLSLALLVILPSDNKKGNNVLDKTKISYQEKINETEKLRQLPAQQQKLNLKAPDYEIYNFKYTYDITIQNNPVLVTFRVPIPPEEKERQYISNLEITPKPNKMINDGTNDIAEYTFINPMDGIYSISISGTAKTRPFNLYTASILNKKPDNEKNLQRYLKPEPLIESDDPIVKRTANSIKGNTTEEIIQNTYEYLQNNFQYVIIPQDIGAKEALKIKKGKCGEYTAAMTAILRAKNIPARIVSGNIARENDQKHNWVEVYFDKYGWITVDPTDRGVIFKTFNNGKLEKQERKLDFRKSNMNYIISERNSLMPWFLSASVNANRSPRINVSEKIEIHKQ